MVAESGVEDQEDVGMKVILVLFWMGVGSSNAVAIHSVEFRSMDSCERVRDTFLNHRFQYGHGSGYKMAVCVEDK